MKLCPLEIPPVFRFRLLTKIAFFSRNLFHELTLSPAHPEPETQLFARGFNAGFGNFEPHHFITLKKDLNKSFAAIITQHMKLF